MAAPASGAELGVNVFGVVAPLRGQNDVALCECLDIVGVFEGGFILRHGRRFATCIRGGKENRLDQIEIFFLQHAVDQNRSDHAAPAY